MSIKKVVGAIWRNHQVQDEERVVEKEGDQHEEGPDDETDLGEATDSCSDAGYGGAKEI